MNSAKATMIDQLPNQEGSNNSNDSQLVDHRHLEEFQQQQQPILGHWQTRIQSYLHETDLNECGLPRGFESSSDNQHPSATSAWRRC